MVKNIYYETKSLGLQLRAQIAAKKDGEEKIKRIYE